MSALGIRDRVEPAAARAMSALAPFATKNGALPKRQEGPTNSRAATITSSAQIKSVPRKRLPARCEKVLAYKGT